jgi:two-component system, cell cycle response regulator DivK
MAINPHEAVVLIVEDNADNLFIATELLRTTVKPRYINGRASGRQLFKLVETLSDKPIHLILQDLQIPHEDGYAILKQIRAHPRLKDTLVIAMTANVMPDDVERARLAGFDGFLGKPLVRSRFADQLDRILGGELVWEPR